VTFGSCFSGVGGLDLGLERAGLECRWQIEIDDYAIRVLEKHWPDVKRYRDITKVEGRELEPVDLICGGFPCQDLSQAGKRAGIEGSRSGLWFEFARLVGELGPRWVLIENVPGLLVHDAMRRVVGELARLGYVGCWRSLRAAECGASHLRKRVFIVAHGPRRGLGELRQPSGGWTELCPTAPSASDGSETPLCLSAPSGWESGF
jgi:DNA (cytosine-5)-methyltransferase 1